MIDLSSSRWLLLLRKVLKKHSKANSIHAIREERIRREI